MKALNEEIKSGQLKKVYLLYGEEAYLKKMYKDRLRKAVLPAVSYTHLDVYKRQVQGREMYSFCYPSMTANVRSVSEAVTVRSKNWQMT